MTTNQMIKLFAKICKDAPKTELSDKEKKMISDLMEVVKNAK